MKNSELKIYEVAFSVTFYTSDEPTSNHDYPLDTEPDEIKQSSDGPFIAYPKIEGAYQLMNPVPLDGNLIGLERGYVADILGSYSSDATFIVTKSQRNNWIRLLKYAVSLLGLLLAAILFFRRYRFSSYWRLPLVHR